MKNIKTVEITKIPSVFKNVSFPKTVSLSQTILPKEGSIIMVEAGNHEGKLNTLDFVSGRLGMLWQWDKIPAVFGYRKATTEFAGFVPEKVKPGDELYLLCESGIVGNISGVFESWGRPIKVKILGSILDKQGNLMNLKDFSLPSVKKTQKKSIPLIIFLGTRMDCGKTTMACKIAHNLTALGKKVSGVKVTGTAFTQDLMKLKDAGVFSMYDFVDMGIPSTCNGNSSQIVNSALQLIEKVKTENPDYVLVEFGDAVLGEYHVADILKNEDFKKQITTVILAGNDLAGIGGTKEILSQWGISVDIVTGPVVNSKIGVGLIAKYFQLQAESNQYEISKTMEIVKKKTMQ